MRTVIESSYVYPVAVEPGASLEAWLDAWAKGYVAHRSWPLEDDHSPRLTERARVEIEQAVNRDLEHNGRSERIDVSSEFAEQDMDLRLRWKIRS